MARLENLTTRGLETQKHLSEILMGLILEKGYDKVSVQDITKAAGIDRTTFYLHFKGKDQLFIQAQEATIGELFFLRNQNSLPFGGIRITFEHMATHRDRYLAFFRSAGLVPGGDAIEQSIVESMIPIIEAEFAGQGEVNRGWITPLAYFLSGALRSLARWWLEENPALPAEKVAHFFLQVATQGAFSLRNPHV